jgi:hypothetical protein
MGKNGLVQHHHTATDTLTAFRTLVVDRQTGSFPRKVRLLFLAAAPTPSSSQLMMMISFAALPRKPHAQTNRPITTTNAVLKPKNEQSAAAMKIMMLFASLDNGSCWTTTMTRQQPGGWSSSMKKTSRSQPILTPSHDDGLVHTQGNVVPTFVSQWPHCVSPAFYCVTNDRALKERFMFLLSET